MTLCTLSTIVKVTVCRILEYQNLLYTALFGFYHWENFVKSSLQDVFSQKCNDFSLKIGYTIRLWLNTISCRICSNSTIKYTERAEHYLLGLCLVEPAATTVAEELQRLDVLRIADDEWSVE